MRLEVGSKQSCFLSTSSFYASFIMSFIIGRKIEMTQLFSDDGMVIPVTLIQAEPNTVTQVRTDKTDGYLAIQVGIETKSRILKPQVGHLKNLENFSVLREFRVNNDNTLQRGDAISVEVFERGARVDVVGVSKGRGYAGVVKRHHFKGGKATHGNKDQQRMGGSIGSQRQGKVIKGQRMAGRMGDERVTIKNLEVISTDSKTNIIALKGAVPGARGGLIMIKTRPGKTVWHA